MNTPSFTPAPQIVSGEGNADVLFVKAEEQKDGNWTFAVTVSHPDTGWEDYADGWDVVLQDGTVIKPNPESPFTRLLAHPHVDEQPFTRSQSGILIPSGVRYVVVRAHDLADGFGGESVVVDLLAPIGENFEVSRLAIGQAGAFGLTNHNLDGNRYLTGQIDLPNASQLDIPLKGIPEWVVGVPLVDGNAIWVVALQDGELQAFQVITGGYVELALPFSALAEGTPPAVRATVTGFELLNQSVKGSAAGTHPIHLAGDQLVYISNTGRFAAEYSRSNHHLACRRAA